jgi:hypothetical protein
MGEIVHLDAWRAGHRPVPAGGMIDLFTAPNGLVGVDAILPPDVALATLGTLAAHGAATGLSNAAGQARRPDVADLRGARRRARARGSAGASPGRWRADHGRPLTASRDADVVSPSGRK